MNRQTSIKVSLQLILVAICLAGAPLRRGTGILLEYRPALLSYQWLFIICLAIWCGTFLFLTFGSKDLPLIGLLIVATGAYFIGYTGPRLSMDAAAFLTGVTLGKLSSALRYDKQPGILCNSDCRVRTAECKRLLEMRSFLVGLVLLLAFSSWWHLELPRNFYHGPRWMGLWNNPNTYGILMGVGVVLAIGLHVAGQGETGKATKALSIALFIVEGMMAVGLLFSYSRGAWLGTAIGLLYLAKVYSKLKWKYILPAAVVVTGVVLSFWNATPNDAPWYEKRMDFGRPSAQHRVAAWRAGLEIMWAYPLGVGWDNAVETYQKDYSPPGNYAMAIKTNDYLLLGTQLGWLGLLCFLMYVGLCFKRVPGKGPEWSTNVACRAAALSMLVEFWFDGGLFTLATASVFWILLEFGRPDLSRPDPV